MERDLRHLYDDIASGAGLLTRLPLPAHDPRGIQSAWSWPLVGAFLGALAALGGWVGLAAGLPVTLAAVVVLVVQVMCTGGLHEDGLADTADGLWGGWTVARRLEIMHDSRIGSYGVIALIVMFLARWSVIVALLAGGYGATLIAAAALSRGVLPGIMHLVPNARTDGLSRGVGRPEARTAVYAALWALGIAVFCAGWAGLGAGIAVLVVACAISLIARARIGGQTGDILGAVQGVAEIAALIVLLG